jgi:hypothetical protein
MKLSYITESERKASGENLTPPPDSDSELPSPMTVLQHVNAAKKKEAPRKRQLSVKQIVQHDLKQLTK